MLMFFSWVIGALVWVTWVCTLSGTRHELACYRWQTMRLSLGVSGALTHMNCFRAANGLLFKFTGQSSLESVHDQVLDIPSRSRIRPTEKSGCASWMLEFSHYCTPVVLVVSIEWCASTQSLDIAGGAHVSKDAPDVGVGDFGVRLGYTCGGDGETVSWILMVGFEGAEKLRSSSN